MTEKKSSNTRRIFLKKSILGLSGSFLSLYPLTAKGSKKKKPNILWIVSEDNSPFLGCYGDKNATTPNIDKLASEGIIFDNAFANAPVCAPMRNTIITGMYANILGCHNMRSNFKIPKNIKFFPQYLKEAGYYCTNNMKEDYNTIKPDNVWDESSNTAHYTKRKKDQPFFAIFNTNLSHEHKIHFNELIDIDKLQHKPEDMKLAPYHPDLPEMRHCYANYYDYITKMDKKVGEILKELDNNGETKDTIVFYYSDHGGVLPRSKRFIFESGTKIPLIVRFPKNYKNLAPSKPGTHNNRLVSLIDLPPTLCSLLNIQIPKQFQGHAFLGKQKSKEPDYIHFFRQRMDERYDMMRAVRDKNFRYIRNYMPHRKYGQHIWYLWRSTATRAWEKSHKEGKCNEVQSRFWSYKKPEELYDIKTDPHNIINLADDPTYKDVLLRMRKEHKRWIRENYDAGFIPEGIMNDESKFSTIYEMTHKENFPMEQIIETAEIASGNNLKFLPELITQLSNKEPTVRYWAATGCAILGAKANKAIPKLKELLNDPVANVRISSAEALCKMGYKQKSLDLLVREMKNDNPSVQLHALNVLDALEDDAKLVLKDIISWVPWAKDTDVYFHQVFTQLIKKLKPGWDDYIVW